MLAVLGNLPRTGAASVDGMAGSRRLNVGARRQRAQARIATQLGEIGFALPGSVAVRSYPCGKPNCSCHAPGSTLHGPYIQWTRKLDNKTVNRRLTPEQWEDFKPWFDNARRLRELVAELEALSLEIVESDQRWTAR